MKICCNHILRSEADSCR